MEETPKLDFSSHYESLTDDDLTRLASDTESLLPQARVSLKQEMDRRSLSTSFVDWNPQSKPVPDELSDPSAGSFRRFCSNFALFFICDVVFTVSFAVLLSHLSNIDIEKFTGAMTQTLVSLSLLLAFITAKVIVPKSIKTLFFIGIAIPVATMMVLILALPHR